MRVSIAAYLSILLLIWADCTSGFQSGFGFPTPVSPLGTPKQHGHEVAKTPSPLSRAATFLRLSDAGQTPENADGVVDKAESKYDDDLFNAKTTVFLVGGQSLLIAVAVVFATFFNIPNYGLGPQIEFSSASLQSGLLMTLPLGILAVVLDKFEDKIPALQEVTKATQRSVLALLGGKFKPVLGLIISIALGFAAGFGEEMLFRGILQYGIGEQFGNVAGVAVASIIFGALHAVTPLYAFLAWLASIYFGYLYLASGNLAVPIFTHAIYDVGALLYAHWTVAKLTNEERSELAKL